MKLLLIVLLFCAQIAHSQQGLFQPDVAKITYVDENNEEYFVYVEHEYNFPLIKIHRDHVYLNNSKYEWNLKKAKVTDYHATLEYHLKVKGKKMVVIVLYDKTPTTEPTIDKIIIYYRSVIIEVGTRKYLI